MLSSNFTIIHFKKALSTINALNMLIGYPLVVSIFIPLTGNAVGSSQIVTYPYRALSLMLALLIIFINLPIRVKLNNAIRLFMVFWIFVIVRMYYDLAIRSDVYIPEYYIYNNWLIVFGIIIIPLISILVSYRKIDFKLLLKYFFWTGIIILVISVFTITNESNLNQRASLNIALDSISFGNTALLFSIVAVYLLSIERREATIWKKTLYLIIFLTGIYIALLSGSRGPIISFIVVILLWYSLSKKKLIWSGIIFSTLTLLIILLDNYLIEIIGVFSPLTAFRINQAISGGDLSVINRQDSYAWFISRIFEDPIFGSQYARLITGSQPGYAHNIILDILLGFGVVGLSVFTFIIYKGINFLKFGIIHKYPFWLGLIMLQFLLLSMTSGAYYSNPQLNAAILLSLLAYSNESGYFHKNVL